MDSHRTRSSNSDRYFILFSPPPGSDSPSLPITAAAATGALSDELQEDDIFSTSAGSDNHSNISVPVHNPVMIARTRSMTNTGLGGSVSHRRRVSHPEQPSGILGLLHDVKQKQASASTNSLHRKATIGSATARMIPAPKVKVKDEFSAHCKSAPLNIPVGFVRKPRGTSWLAGGEEEEEFTNTGPEMLPPHEIVARKEANTPLTSSSCFEGIGRTLKGRDLRMVRNAVWRQTGFLD